MDSPSPHNSAHLINSLSALSTLIYCNSCVVRPMNSGLHQGPGWLGLQRTVQGFHLVCKARGGLSQRRRCCVCFAGV
jgi:hypothetical protein